MLDQKAVNLALGRLLRFTEMFQVGAFHVQPHVLHLNFEASGRESHLHTHQTFEFSLLMRGRACYQVEGAPVELEEGDTIVIPPRTSHCWTMREDSLILGFMLFIACQGDNSQQQLKLLRERVAEHRYHIRQSPELKSLGGRIVLVAGGGGAYTEERMLCLTREAYIELIAALVPQSVEVAPVAGLHLRGESGDRMVDAASYYVWDNNYRAIAAAEVARHVGVGLNRLNGLFREHRGITVGQMIAIFKMNRAKEMLESSPRPVKDIAAALGFEDTNYFCAFFRKHEGMSASAYRMLKRR